MHAVYPGLASSDAGILAYEACLHNYNYVDVITKCGHVK